MSGRLIPISGCGSKGPACFVVESGKVRIMLDLGYGPQPGLRPDVSAVGPVDALLLSHSHRDHAGALELRSHIANPRIYASAIVRRLVADAVSAEPLPLRGSVDVCGIRVTTGRSGHAPGSVWLHLDVGGGLLYMGDTSAESAVYDCDKPAQANTVILDASYGTYDTALSEAVRQFDRIFDAGPVLLPVPAAGRGADIALYIARSGRALPHIDRSLRTVLQNLGSEYRDCARADALPDLARIADEAPDLHDSRGVMLACVADASTGEASRLVAAWEHTNAPAIVFTGYLPPGTAAERLTRSGRAQYLRWNVHPTLSQNVRLVRETAARTVLPAFGDAHHLTTWQSAFAPARVALNGSIAL